ncbi:MAG: ROK family protein [Gemmatimonadaceae bacterium]
MTDFSHAVQNPSGTPMKVLVVDIGGSNIKVLATGQDTPRKVESGPDLTPADFVAAVRRLTDDWEYEVVSIGFPAPVNANRLILEPKNLGPGWCDFDFATAFERPVKVLNDALMQAIGGYEGGRMLFLGLGTGLGSALVFDGLAHPLELAKLPYRKHCTFEQRVSAKALRRLGKRKWRRRVSDVVARLQAALLADYVLIGGGNVHLLKAMPQGARRGDNSHAFVGGFRLWETGGVRL